jgi:hypothetical protein
MNLINPCSWFHEQMSFIIGKLTKLNKRFGFGSSDIEIPRYKSREPNYFGLYSRKCSRNESSLMKMVVSEKEKQKRKFIQLDLFIEISVGCFLQPS